MANFNLDENIPILTATQQHSITAAQQQEPQYDRRQNFDSTMLFRYCQPGQMIAS